ncbi:MAG: hypothetical protein ABEJ76_01625 [Halanaeroarchaeum sp.]
MEIREATGGDVDALEALVDDDFDAARLLRERTVVVATDGEDLVGFASYDTWSGTVHVSSLVGDPPVVDRLLDEPIRFAEREGLAVEIVVPDDDEDLTETIVDLGFEVVGKGPLFDGKSSHRYRYVQD